MKQFLLSALFIAYIFRLSAQVMPELPSKDSAPIFTFVEQMPEFPGGEKELIKFLQQNIMYPQMERDNNIQGKVLLRFVVNEDGSVTDVSVVRSVSPGLDKEAVRVVKVLPKFKPGHQQGRPVKVYFNLPIVYKLQDNSPAEEKVINEKVNKDKNFRSAYGQYKFKKYADAIKYLKKSIKTFPDDYLSYELMGDCEFNLGNLKNACKNYLKAKEKKSPSAEDFIKKNCN